MSRTRLTRRERLVLASATLGGVVSGTVRATVTWLLNQLTS
ncbi:hypothetical protein ACWC4A_38120 [Streptomyces mirabilis]